jgi:N6-adenosine-specific RNA methylase IME4
MYNTIVLDPPWDISLSGKNIRRKRQAIKLDYKTLPLEKIKQIPLNKMANPGSHIYCWTTNKMLPYTFNVLKSWGVNYHLTLVWTKHNGMTPNFAYKFATEFCLLGFYQKPMQKFLRCGKLNWINTNAPRKHSTKPQEFFDLVDEMSPPPKLEMFARAYRSNWDCWGDELKCKINNETKR